MKFLEEIKKRQAMSPKERIMSSLKNRREKIDPWIRNLQMHTIARDIVESELSPGDLAEATDEEKEELKEILQRWSKET
jgi:hypothetical protein